MNEKDKNVGKNVRIFRENFGLSTKNVADHSHYSVSAIKKYETGERRVSIEFLDTIKKGLMISIDDFRETVFPSVDFVPAAEIKKDPVAYFKKLVRIQFPIIKVDPSVETIAFLCANTLHSVSLGLHEDFSFEVSVLKESKEKYREDLNNPVLKPYVAANLISLTLFYAFLINSLYAPEMTLPGYAACIHLDLRPITTPQKVFDGIDIEKHYEKLHQDRVVNRLWEYLECIYNDERLHDLSLYLQYWLIYFDLAKDIDNEAQKMKLTQHVMDSLLDTNNRYLIQLLECLVELYPGLKTLLCELDHQ